METIVNEIITTLVKIADISLFKSIISIPNLKFNTRFFP